MSSPPPIQEPWKLDQFGRLRSPAWVLWLQGLVDSSSLNSLFSQELNFQSTQPISTSISSTSQDDIELISELFTEPSSTTINSNDSEMLVWMSF